MSEVKARMPIDSKMLKQVKEQVFKDFFAVMQQNKALDILAVSRCFGIGKKRMQRYIDTLQELRAEFDEWQKDDVFEEKLKPLLAEIGIDYTELMDGNVKLHDFKQTAPTEMSEAEKAKYGEKLRGHINDDR